MEGGTVGHNKRTIPAWFQMKLYWCHWLHFNKSSINILSLIWFARNRLLLTSQVSHMMSDCSQKSILAKPINDSIYFFQVQNIIRIIWYQGSPNQAKWATFFRLGFIEIAMFLPKVKALIALLVFVNQHFFHQ
jgi:hypothetical protein